MTQSKSIIIITEKDKDDAPSFEASVKAMLSPSKNNLCVSFMHKVKNEDLGTFDNLIKRKRPTLLLFTGIRSAETGKLFDRASKKSPTTVFATDVTGQHHGQMKYYNMITLETIAVLLKNETETAALVKEERVTA